MNSMPTTRSKILSHYLKIPVKDFNLQGLENLEPFMGPPEKHSAPLVWLLQHGAMLSWLVVPAIIQKVLFEQFPSWAEQRKYQIYYQKILGKIPIFNKIAKFIGPHGKETNVKQVKELLQKGKLTDVGTMPEGENCCLDFGEAIAPFIHAGLIKVALELQLPIVIVTHKGTEAWSLKVGHPLIEHLYPKIPLPFSYGARGIQVPVPFMRIKQLSISCGIYHTSVSKETFNAHNNNEKSYICIEEVAKVQQFMKQQWLNM